VKILLILLVLLLVFLGLGRHVFALMVKKKAPVILALTGSLLMVAALVVVTILALRLHTGPAELVLWIALATAMLSVAASICWLLWQFLMWLGKADPAGGSVNPEERQRIIAMVEQRKMTAQEGTELLDALGKSSALRGQQRFSRLDIMILVGVAATITGFFLPWQWLNLFEGATGLRMYQTGYQVGVIGGVMIGCSILTAILVFITPKDWLYKLLLMQVMWICVGLAIVVSVWIAASAAVGCGAIICTAGFAIALIGAVMKMQALGR
jgi:hypothetical protein